MLENCSKQHQLGQRVSRRDEIRKFLGFSLEDIFEHDVQMYLYVGVRGFVFESVYVRVFMFECLCSSVYVRVQQQSKERERERETKKDNKEDSQASTRETHTHYIPLGSDV